MTHTALPSRLPANGHAMSHPATLSPIATVACVPQPRDADPDPAVSIFHHPVLRGIARVEDGRSGSGGAVRTADAVLDPLDAAGLVRLRHAEFEARRNGGPLFHCALCQGPVHSRVKGVLAAGVTGGRRAFFVHDPRPAARYCPAGTLSDGNSPAMIDALRFNGRQEGKRHAMLKTALMTALQQDPLFEDVAVEQIVRDGNGGWRKPDVLATTPWGKIGFDVQLVPPLLDCILGRQRFYAGAGIGHLWVVDGANPDGLIQQGFLDVVMAQGGVVMGFDEAAASLSHNSGTLILHLVSLTEDADQHQFTAASEPIGRHIVLDFAGLRSTTAMPMARDLRAASFFTALRTGDTKGRAAILSTLSSGCGNPDTAAAEADGIFGVVATLATLVTGRKADASGFADSAVNAVVNHFLRSEQPGMRPNDVHRAWAPVLARAAFHPAVMPRIDKPGTRTRPLLDAALGEVSLAPVLSQRLIRDWLPLLDRLFPGLHLPGLDAAATRPPAP